MKRLLTIAAISLALVGSACSTDGGQTPSAASTAAGTTASPLTSTPSTTTSTTSAPTTGTSAATTVAVDQSTPEAAMTSWLAAMFAGDTKEVCALMATKGKAIADVPQAVETCSSMIGTMLEQLKPLAPQFKGLTITGATITGDAASFEKATTKPALAAQIIKTFKAVRIKGKWYITQG